MFGRILDMLLLHVKIAGMLTDKNTSDHVMEWNLLDIYVVSYIEA